MPCCFVALVALFTPGCAWCPSAFFPWVPLLPCCSGYRFAKPEIRPNFSGSHTFFLTATAKEPDRRLAFALLPIYILPLLRCCPDVDNQRQFLHLTYAFGGIQLGKVVGQSVHATIPKGNMGCDQYTAYFCCFLLAHANIVPCPLVSFFQVSLNNYEFKTTQNTFRDCRVHFSDNLSRNSCRYAWN